MECGNFVPHTCRVDRIPANDPVDIVADMQTAVDELARNEIALSPSTIWEQLDEQFPEELKRKHFPDCPVST
ncbi:hypothetical protein PC129_g7081 [Phytophthora cactorum]|uniref:Uncharacterized protein n=1 Tax=Phytophthora cactorum TaxID=29920 RepID=A0A329S5R3_9STRA|nr:hypothetical protein Pcac1_g10267 [Phytophthora cactorum]KAG2838347.1 hypothetical protein PC112_g4542 [Phytophthora cactorum]KAG2915994.1 hypothetical protein PC114_g7635 [Phytophthora cactorum]KAG2945866.1 hypothetical protein PC117_g8118 [Phytophthora cactorum]KAG2988461.1 hypothetical protein PC118_g6689 [Phytophthora cactorum]